MTTDPFTDAAMEHLAKVDHDKSREWFDGFVACTRWARDHLARQEATDAEVLAALNAQGVIVSPKMHPAPNLGYWGERPKEAMRAAIAAAKEARA